MIANVFYLDGVTAVYVQSSFHSNQYEIIGQRELPVVELNVVIRA